VSTVTNGRATGWRKREIEEAQMQDEEFNRLEAESRVRQEYVRQQMKKQQDDIPASIPFVTPEDWEAVLKNN